MASHYTNRRDCPRITHGFHLHEILRATVDGVSSLAREDLRVTRLVLAYGVWQLDAALWDLPCSYGWENDGIAPRDIFGGLALNLTPGQGHRYPLFHYLLLALPCLPIVLIGAARASDLGFASIRDTMLSVPALTAIHLVAKLLSVGMGGLTVLTLARIARRLFGPSAGVWSAGFAITNLSLSYYTRSVNLDGPYLMWGVLAADRLLDVLEFGRTRDYIALAVSAALSIATKDQAYSLYVLSLPLYVVVGAATLPAGAQHYRRLGRGAVWGALCLGVAGGGLFNPTGFVTRLRLLSGPNSQDWRQYGASMPGVLANLRDIGAALPDFWWPRPVLLLAAFGVVLALAQERGGAALQRRSARLVPLAFGISSFLTFTLVVGRCGHRFMLPLGAFAACYAGHAAGTLVRIMNVRSLGARLAGALLGVLLVSGATQVLALQLTQWGDARREVERWLARLPPGSSVETYGLGVYLPRFDLSPAAPYRVQRVGPGPSKRPPIPGMLELYEPYGQVSARLPDVLVIPEGFAGRFATGEQRAGRTRSNELVRYQSDADAYAFFAKAREDRLPGYRLELEARPHLPRWAAALPLSPVALHGSTGQRTWILVRTSARVSARSRNRDGYVYTP